MKTNIIIIIMLLFTACGGKKNSQTEESIHVDENTVILTAAQLQSVKIKLGKLEQKAISSVVKLNGTIDAPPQNVVSVSMPLGGYLKSTKLLPGMHINRGEVIATMEDQQYIQLQQDYLTTKSKLAFAEAEYLRQKELNQSKASSDKVFQQAQMEYYTQKFAYKALAEKLRLININPQTLSVTNLSKRINIYSPISGYVSKVDVNIGKYVNPTDVLFELVNPADIHLNLKVFEKDIDKLSIGQKVMAYNNEQPEKKYSCEIILISKNISPERTAEVHCHFEEYNKTLLPGMYMNAEVQVSNTNVLSLIEDAVVTFEGNNYVFISTGKNQFEIIPVEVGTKENRYVEVKNHAVFSGKQIVIQGAYALLMKMKNKSEE